MEDPFCDFEGAVKVSEGQRLADCVKGDAESLLFKNLAQFEVTNYLEEEENGRNYFKIDVKIGDDSYIQLRVLKPSADVGEVITLVDVEEKTA